MSCTNCSKDSVVFFDDPSQTYVGRFRECGLFPCTGKLNYFIEDHDGSLLGKRGAWIPNSEIGNGTDECVFNEKMNGFICEDEEFVVMEY